MIYIDKCAYTNRLKDIHPLEKILFAIATMIVNLAANSIFISIVSILMMGWITVYKAKTSLKLYFQLMLAPLGFLVLSTVTIMIIIIPSHVNEALVSLSLFKINFGVTPQSLEMAVKLFFRSLGAVSCLYFLSLTTPLVDIVSILRKLKLPEIFLELMSLIYRLIFILVEIIGRVYVSQSSRLGYSTLKNQFRSLSGLVSCLFSHSYKKANDMFIALESRCYDGKLRVLEKQYKLRKANIVYIILIELMLLVSNYLI